MNQKMMPILFNTGMVKAILEGRKTVTRRILKPGQDGHICGMRPPCEVGDILYVRETWRFVPCNDCKLSRDYPCSAPTAMHDNGAGEAEGCFDYKASAAGDSARWYPSIHMPKKAARIFLKVKSVRAERLQEITDADAKAEGVADRKAFAVLWDTTIKKADREVCGWAANPWVWVVEYELYRGEH